MAIGTGRTAVQDSEEEPMTSSPVSVPDEALDKLSATAPVSLQAPQDATPEANGSLQDHAERIGSTVPQRTDGLGAGQDVASLHLEAPIVDEIGISAMRHNRTTPTISNDGTAFQAGDASPQPRLGFFQEPVGHDVAPVQLAQAGEGQTPDENPKELNTDTTVNKTPQSSKQPHSRTAMSPNIPGIQLNKEQAESEQDLVSNTPRGGDDGAANHNNPSQAPHDSPDTPRNPLMAAGENSSILNLGTPACQILSADMQYPSMIGASSQMQSNANVQSYARQPDTDAAATATESVVCLRPISCSSMRSYAIGHLRSTNVPRCFSTF